MDRGNGTLPRLRSSTGYAPANKSELATEGKIN